MVISEKSQTFVVYLGRKACKTEEPNTGTVETVEDADIER